MQWMERQKVVESDAQVMLGLSLLFLLVCLLNTIGLLLAKFLGKSGDIGLRRALGASRSSLFTQHMIGSALIGLGGGVLGLGLTWLGQRGVHHAGTFQANGTPQRYRRKQHLLSG